jgi:hypothetical protein
VEEGEEEEVEVACGKKKLKEREYFGTQYLEQAMVAAGSAMRGKHSLSCRLGTHLPRYFKVVESRLINRRLLTCLGRSSRLQNIAGGFGRSSRKAWF